MGCNFISRPYSNMHIQWYPLNIFPNILEKDCLPFVEDKFPYGYRLYQVMNFIMTISLNEINHMQNKFCFIYKQVKVFATRLIFSVCFLQDNDCKHKSKSRQDWMPEKGKLQNVMTTPVSSPDLNPIENVWASMKYYLQTMAKPRTKDQLIWGIRYFWDPFQQLSVDDT